MPPTAASVVRSTADESVRPVTGVLATVDGVKGVRASVAVLMEGGVAGILAAPAEEASKILMLGWVPVLRK